jgi:hypothetical protein
MRIGKKQHRRSNNYPLIERTVLKHNPEKQNNTSDKSVDIKFSGHGAFHRVRSIKIVRLESQII